MGPSLAAEGFDRWACGYDHSALQPLLYRPVHAAVLEICARSMPEPRSVLDLGCGTGRLLRDSQQRFPGAQLVGLDVSAKMLAVAAAACGRLIPVRGRAEALPFTCGVFDLVMATFTYRHWHDRASGVAEVGRVLAGGGVFGLATIITSQQRGLTHRWRQRRRRGLPESLATALTDAGLVVRDVDHVSGIGPIADVTIVVACLASPITVAGSKGLL